MKSHELAFHGLSIFVLSSRVLANNSSDLTLFDSLNVLQDLFLAIGFSLFHLPNDLTLLVDWVDSMFSSRWTSYKQLLHERMGTSSSMGLVRRGQVVLRC